MQYGMFTYLLSQYDSPFQGARNSNNKNQNIFMGPFLYTPPNGRRQHHYQIPTPHLKNYSFKNLPKTPPVSISVLLYVICCLYMNFSEVLTSAPHSYFFVYVLNISKYSYTYLYFGHNRVKILPDGEAFSPTNYPYTTHSNSF